MRGGMEAAEPFVGEAPPGLVARLKKFATAVVYGDVAAETRTDDETWDYNWHNTKDDAKRVWTEWWGRAVAHLSAAVQAEQEGIAAKAWGRDNYVLGHQQGAGPTNLRVVDVQTSVPTSFPIQFEELDIGNVYKIVTEKISVLTGITSQITKYFKITAIGTLAWAAGLGRPTPAKTRAVGPSAASQYLMLEVDLDGDVPTHMKYFSLVYKGIITDQPDGSEGDEVFLKFKYYNGEGGDGRSEQEKLVAFGRIWERGRGGGGAERAPTGGWFYSNSASGYFWVKNPDWPNTHAVPWYQCDELYPFISFERVS